MSVISMIREFFDIECDEVREMNELALNDAIECVNTMRIAYEITTEMRACELAQERYDELAN